MAEMPSVIGRSDSARPDDTLLLSELGDIRSTLEDALFGLGR